MKHTLQHAKYSGSNPQLALLALRATPVDNKIPSPAELLYQHQLPTTVPAKIWNTDPVMQQICDQLDEHASKMKSNAGKNAKSLAPFYAGYSVAVYDTVHKIWVPATVLHVLANDSYQVQTSDGNT